MKLRMHETHTLVLVELFRKLAALGYRPVLVGGLVPPLLLEILDPFSSEVTLDPRRTTDCDVAIDVAIHGHEKWREVEQLLTTWDFEKRPRKNQFRWSHRCGLQLDPLPVPSGIEQGEPNAVAFARTLDIGDASTFFRGYEVALDLSLEVSIELSDGSSCMLRIAGLASVLAMKLQAWTDRRYERKKDAHDIGWLLRYLSPEIAARHLLEARKRWPAVTAEVIQRLEMEFSDPEHRGVCDYATQAHGIDESFLEGHRNAVSSAVTQILRLYRQG